ncbi:endonuclease-reverse transcriptase [Plakobranchus ocellatus]|uniref:Endonuclease-reverse transcriptase n=1 Tax=Plakobranchus ocellatus TaxID=259542 RepID=A0AAV4CDU1_9GAST|nr:endonuclease-reverse transcriptase [Plakobranchus ocellatus]
MVHKDIEDYIESFDKHSDRIISCKIKLQGGSLQLIEAYAPTTECDDADVEIFYEELENAMDPKCKYKVIEKSNEYNLPLCAGFIDYEKAFDSEEHFSIFDALRKININETYDKGIRFLRNCSQRPLR